MGLRIKLENRSVDMVLYLRQEIGPYELCYLTWKVQILRAIPIFIGFAPALSGTR